MLIFFLWLVQLQGLLFASFVPTNELPDVFHGEKVTNVSEWERHWKPIVRGEFAEHVMGRAPVTRPQLQSWNKVNESGFFRLQFDEWDLSFVVQAFNASVNAADHLFVTQFTHGTWAAAALRRGFSVLVVPACDEYDASPQLPSKTYSWGLIRKRAFITQLALDWWFTVHDQNQQTRTNVCLGGHSRNGKLSLVTAAADERVSAVISSSSGVPASTPWRFGAGMFGGEGPGANPATSHGWWRAGVPHWYGRENELPVDSHFLLAQIAPRPVLLSTALNDFSGDQSLGNELAARAVEKVYSLYGGGGGGGKHSSSSIKRLYRPGAHHGFLTTDVVGKFVDFCLNPDQFPSSPVLHPRLSEVNGHHEADFVGVPGTDAPLKRKLDWLLGPNVAENAALNVGVPSLYSEQGEAPWSAVMRGQQEASAAGVLHMSLAGYVPMNVYPTSIPVSSPSPYVVWLGSGASVSTGYVQSDYISQRKDPYINWTANVQQSWPRLTPLSVAAVSLVGTGSRIEEAAQFYSRHGNRSAMMWTTINDVVAAVHAIQCFGVSPTGTAGAGCPASGAQFSVSLPSMPRASSVYIAAWSPVAGTAALLAAYLYPHLFSGVALVDTCIDPLVLSSWFPLLPRLALVKDPDQFLTVDQLIANMSVPVFQSQAKQDRFCYQKIAHQQQQQQQTRRTVHFRPGPQQFSNRESGLVAQQLLAWMRDPNKI